MPWMITKDLIEDGRNVGRCSRSLTGENKEACIIPFRLRDDDGELYYEGLMGPDHTFGPLDWAMNYAGATRLEYLEGDQWKGL